jgi:hypothetical protein
MGRGKGIYAVLVAAVVLPAVFVGATTAYAGATPPAARHGYAGINSFIPSERDSFDSAVIPNERDSFDSAVCAPDRGIVLAAYVVPDAFPRSSGCGGVGQGVAQLASELVGRWGGQTVPVEVEGLLPVAACGVGVTGDLI